MLEAIEGTGFEGTTDSLNAIRAAIDALPSSITTKKYAWKDHDTAKLQHYPPVQNEWYEVFHAEDVALIYCAVMQWNDDNTDQDLEVKWTIDGSVYFLAWTQGQGQMHSIFRDGDPSDGGTDGLIWTAPYQLALQYCPKHGLDFKVEVRMTSAGGLNQGLLAYCVYETLEET